MCLIKPVECLKQEKIEVALYTQNSWNSKQSLNVKTELPQIIFDIQVENN